MARRTKAEKFDIEVEAALEEALDFDFDDDALDTKLKGNVNTDSQPAYNEQLSADDKRAETLDIESLEQQIALVTEELQQSAENSAGSMMNGKQGGAKAKKTASQEPAITFEPKHTANTPLRSELNKMIEADDSGSGSPAQAAMVENYENINETSRKTKFRFFEVPLYWSTTALSLLWAIGGITAAYKFSLSEPHGTGSFLSSAQGMLVTAGTIVPILMFWGVAQLTRRAKELQQVVDTMTGAAMRLLEPEVSSKERVTSLGHTIRREVAAMGEGIDRTMSRASELEALLQSEVNNLEQAYGENEARIRTLIAELANEREAVSTHADHVKAKITDAKDQLTQEFNSIADHINATAESFTVTLSETLNARWGELVDEFNMANEGVAQQLSKKFVETVQSFDDSRGRFFEELDTRFAQIDQHTEEASKAVAERLGTKMDDFVKIVHERTEDVEGHFNMLTGRLANSGKKIIESVDESVAEIERRSDDIDQRLRSTADKVLNDFDDKFQKLDDAIVDRGNQSLTEFSEQISRLENRAHDLPLTFDNVAEKAVDEFSRQIYKVEEQFNQLSGRLNKNGNAIAETISNSLNEIEERSNDVDVRLNSAADKVLNAFETQFGELDHAFIDRSNHSLDAFKNQVVKLEQQAKDLSSSFDSATGLAIQAFEKRLNQVDDSLSQRSTSLIRSFISRTEALEESTDKLNTALETHVDRVNEAFQLRTRDIVETLSSGRNDILSIIDETKVRLSYEMEIVGTTIGKLVDERAGGFIHQFIEGREKLSNTLETETTRIIDTVNDQINTLSRHVSDMEDTLLKRVTTLDEHTIDHISNLDQKTVVFEQAVSKGFNVAQEAIEIQAKNIDIRADSLRDSLSLNSEALNKVLGEQANVLEGRIAHIRDIIANSNVSFTDVMNKHASIFRESINSNDEVLKGIFIDHLKNLEEQTGRLKNAFSDNQISLFQSIDNRIGLLQDSLTGSQSVIEDVLINHGSLVSERAAELQKDLVYTLSEVNDKLDDQGKLLDKRALELRDAVDHNSTVLEDSFLRQTAVIDERTKTMQKAIEIGVNNVRGVLESNALTLSETLRERISQISNTLNDETQRAETVISSATVNLLDSFVNAVSDADQKITERSLFLKNNVNEAGSQLDMGLAAMESRLLNATSSLTEEAQKAEQIISNVGNRLSGSVIKAAEDVEQKFAQRGSALEGNIQNIENCLNRSLDLIQSRVTGAAADISEEAQKAESLISSAGTKLTNSVAEAAQGIEQKLSDRSLFLKENMHQMEDLIDTSITSIGNRISEITQNTAHQLVDKTDNLHALTEQLKDAATKTGDSLDMLTNQFSDQLKEVARAAEERLRSENDIFISNFSDRAEDIVVAVQSFKSDMESNVAQLLERLDTSNGSIQQTVNALRDNINEVDAQLVDVAAGFKENVGQLSESFISSSTVLNDDLKRFNGLSQNALENIARFSEQFDEHAKLLSEATTILDSSNNQLNEKLEFGQEALNVLASGLVNKSDEIANVMQNCEEIIASVMRRTEERTKSSTLHLQTSLSELINEASGKFEGATEEIRKSAEEIRLELSRTRADLNHGVRTLPSQTKEYTDAMRKAVMEQIEALKDLSGIVEESGRLLDGIQPKDSSNSGSASILKQRAQQRLIPTPLVNRPAQPVQSSQPILATAAAAPVINTAEIPKEVNGVSKPTPRPTSSNTKTAQSRGWVSDLLARASRDDLDRSSTAETKPQKAETQAETLNSMSANIVQAIDRNAITQLWQHYRRGQRNIASNRLYTTEGQQTFEKIKHKYALDGEFRRAVGQYITDFERLLGDVTKNGGNNNTVREYLTSDTGKVYTMLAHVSGRIQ